MANYRRNRTRGHDPHAQFRIQHARAEARGVEFAPEEKTPKGFEPGAIDTSAPHRSGAETKPAKKPRAPRRRK